MVATPAGPLTRLAKEILVLGSVAWDEVVRLDTPLAVGGHNQGRWEGCRIGGGAANTAMALARVGDRARLVSAVGRDPSGRALLGDLAAQGLDVSAVGEGTETTRSLLLLDPQGERTIVNLARAKVRWPGDLADWAADACYVRAADPALGAVLARLAERMPVVAHIPPVEEGLRPVPILVGSVSDLTAEQRAHPFALGERVAGERLEWVVITRGAEGAVAYGRDGTIECPARRVRVVDGTGAGDVFAAGLVYGLARGWPMAHVLEVAVSWGTASVTYVGTIPPEHFPRPLAIRRP